MKSMTDKEKAKRYDSLQVAIRVYLDIYQKRLKEPIPERDILKAWEQGNRAAIEEFVEALGRWLG